MKEEAINALNVTVEHNGKVYETSYDMKQQVVVFMEMVKLLTDCRLQVFGSGLLPDVFRQQ